MKTQKIVWRLTKLCEEVIVFCEESQNYPNSRKRTWRHRDQEFHRPVFWTRQQPPPRTLIKDFTQTHHTSPWHKVSGAGTVVTQCFSEGSSQQPGVGGKTLDRQVRVCVSTAFGIGQAPVLSPDWCDTLLIYVILDSTWLICTPGDDSNFMSLSQRVCVPVYSPVWVITTHFRKTPHHFFTSQTTWNPIIFHPRLEFSHSRTG